MWRRPVLAQRKMCIDNLGIDLSDDGFGPTYLFGTLESSSKRNTKGILCLSLFNQDTGLNRHDQVKCFFFGRSQRSQDAAYFILILKSKVLSTPSLSNTVGNGNWDSSFDDAGCFWVLPESPVIIGSLVSMDVRAFRW